jgi:hypothetical protein
VTLATIVARSRILSCFGRTTGIARLLVWGARPWPTGRGTT